MPSEKNPSVDEIRSLQASLNTAIDQYATLSSLTISKLDVYKAQSQISQSAASIATICKNPTFFVGELGLLPLLNMAVRMAIDIDIFKHINNATSGATNEDLAKATTTHPTIILRITRHLASFHIFRENNTCPPIYYPTDSSRALANPVMSDWVKSMFDSAMPRWHAVPGFLAKNNYDSVLAPAQFDKEVFGGVSLWDHLAARPEEMKTFQNAMRLTDLRPEEGKIGYPFSAQLGGPPKSGVLIVDVGGGMGHALDSILAGHPELLEPGKGRIFLQDRPEVIDALNVQGERKLTFEVMVHDFFQPQPPETAGARWYFCRSVLHDWDDEHAFIILKNIRDAMAHAADTSALLIEEFVLPDASCPPYETLLDLNMMNMGGIERNVSQWKELLEKAGLRSKKIWTSKIDSRGILEAIVA